MPYGEHREPYGRAKTSLIQHRRKLTRSFHHGTTNYDGIMYIVINTCLLQIPNYCNFKESPLSRPSRSCVQNPFLLFGDRHLRVKPQPPPVPKKDHLSPSHSSSSSSSPSAPPMLKSKASSSKKSNSTLNSSVKTKKSKKQIPVQEQHIIHCP